MVSDLIRVVGAVLTAGDGLRLEVAVPLAHVLEADGTSGDGARGRRFLLENPVTAIE